MQQDLLLNFLLAYLLHSSLLLSCATLAHRASYLRHHRLAEIIWRFVLFGALVTAGIQVAWTHSRSEPLPVSSKQVSLAMPTSTALAASTSPIPTSEKQLAKSEQQRLHSSVPRAEVAPAINLPRSFEFYTRAFFLSWCVFAVFSIISIVLSVFYLNRKISAMPELEDHELQQFADSLVPSNKTVSIRTGDAWQSPLLAPNGSVFLPTWALKTLTLEQCKAMVAHEIAHWRRADHMWRIAYQLTQRLFFFQVFNRYAVAKLDLLAEFDCDNAALRHQSAYSYSETLLECAQRGITGQPRFALAMARPSSLLQRVHSLFQEENMRTPTFSKNTLFAFSLAVITGLSAVSYAMPRFRTDTSKADLAKPNSDLSQRKLTVAKTAPVTTQFAPPATTTRDTKAIVDTKPDATAPTERISEAVSDTRLSQALQAWKENPALAFKLFSELASEGHAEAQEALGQMFWYGEGTAADQKQARLWLGKAATQGRVRAQKFIEMFDERDRRQSELRFYLEEFDGGSLKWTEKVCPAPDLSESKMSVTQLKASLDALNKKIDCYNQYVSNMRTSLQNLSFIPGDLRRLMRDEEIGQAQALAETRYYEFGLKEKAINEDLQATLNQRFLQQAKNADKTRDNFDDNTYWRWRENYDRQLSPQMTINPKSEPAANRAAK